MLKPWHFPIQELVTREVVRQLTTAFAQPLVSLYTGRMLFLWDPRTSEWTKVLPSLGLTTATSGRQVWKALYKEKTAQTGLLISFRRGPKLTLKQCLLVLANKPGRTFARQSVAQNTACRLPLPALTLTPERQAPYRRWVVWCILLKLYLETLVLIPPWVLLTLMVDIFIPINILLPGLARNRSKVPVAGRSGLFLLNVTELAISAQANGPENPVQKPTHRLKV